MKSKSRKELEKKNREQFIISAAERLFSASGFENTIMDEIAKEAEFSKTTIYKYFISKDELALAVYQKLHVEKMKYLKSEMERYHKPSDKIYAFAKAYRKYFLIHPDHLRFQLYWDYKGLARKNIRPEITSYFNDFLTDDVDYMADTIKQGINEGSFRSDLEIEKILDLFYLILRTVMNQVMLININETFGGLLKPKESDYDLTVKLFIDSIKVQQS